LAVLDEAEERLGREAARMVNVASKVPARTSGKAGLRQGRAPGPRPCAEGWAIRYVVQPPGVRTTCMKALWLTAAAFLLTASTAAWAQVQVVNRTINGQPDSDIRVGVYVNVKPDCTSGQLPSIKLVSPPANGKVTVKQGKVTAPNYKQCLALEVPGFIALYHPRADFVGVDLLILEVRYPGGKTEVQKVSVTVGTGAPGRGI
jgi:hypothetical protein